jgi:hypothetical protein
MTLTLVAIGCLFAGTVVGFCIAAILQVGHNADIKNDNH